MFLFILFQICVKFIIVMTILWSRASALPQYSQYTTDFKNYERTKQVGQWHRKHKARVKYMRRIYRFFIHNSCFAMNCNDEAILYQKWCYIKYNLNASQEFTSRLFLIAKFCIQDWTTEHSLLVDGNLHSHFKFVSSKTHLHYWSTKIQK